MENMKQYIVQYTVLKILMIVCSLQCNQVNFTLTSPGQGGPFLNQ